MKSIIALSILGLLVACQPPADAPLSTQDQDTIDSICCQDRTVLVKTADLWKNTWLTYQAMESDTSDSINLLIGHWIYYGFSYDNINSLNPESLMDYGVRVYFGLLDANNGIAKGNLQLFLVGIDPQFNDQYLEGDTPILTVKNGVENWVSKDDAHNSIVQWYEYIDSSPHPFINIYAYDFDWTTVMDLLKNDPNNVLHITPALHSVENPAKYGFCPPNTLVNCGANIIPRGLQVYDLVMEGFTSAQTPITLTCGIIDFANPCPQYCGTVNLLDIDQCQ